jgi:formate dehydrogenase
VSDETFRTAKSQASPHPGRGRKRARPTPKGRQIKDDARERVSQLTADRPLRRDLLLEYLHAINDARGFLHVDDLNALASTLGLAQAEVFEVATFYAHFQIVLDGESPPPALTVRVCDSLSCAMAGAQSLFETLSSNHRGSVNVLRAPCMGRCAEAPIAAVGRRHIGHATIEKVASAIASGDTEPLLPADDQTESLDAYLARGGFATLERIRNGALGIDALIDEIDASGLRGLGGAGFPTARKWQIVRSYDGPRLMAVNADEGEPGTFKDHYYLSRQPFQFLEGMLIAAEAVAAETIYIYLRDEYPDVHILLERAIGKLSARGLVAPERIELRRGAGAYICGEESSMLESIEGKRGLPRHRPPYVAEQGLFGRPTLVQNVETLYWVPAIAERGGAWFAAQGGTSAKGLRSYSVSGRVQDPGVKLAPAGTTVRTLIDDYCGGMVDGHAFKGYLPGGASGGILPASMSELPLDFGELESHGCFVGSHAVVILSDRDNMRDVAMNLMRFFEEESCGQCTPCRVGTEKAVSLMSDERWDLPLLNDLSQTMADASICGLGQAAANPMLSVIKFFAEDLG